MESGDAFFEELEQDIVDRGHFKVHVKLVKSATMIQLYFDTKGTLGLICDRSLEPYEEPFAFNERIILKFGDHDEELTDEIEIINRNTNRINVAKYIFDFIALSLPFKKIHPSLRKPEDDDEFSEDQDEVILVYTSAAETDSADEDSDNTDPRWAALKKLKGEE